MTVLFVQLLFSLIFDDLLDLLATRLFFLQALIGFAILCILSVINGIICIVQSGQPNNDSARLIFAAIVAFISAAMWVR